MATQSISPPARRERRSTGGIAIGGCIETGGGVGATSMGRKALMASVWRPLLVFLMLLGSLMYISVGQLMVERRHKELNIGVQGNGSIGVSSSIGSVQQAGIFEFSRRALAVGVQADPLSGSAVNPWSQPDGQGWRACGQEAASIQKDLTPMRSQGYLLVSTNGGLNQMRAAICDMVAMAYWMNVTLVIPELDKSSFWADSSEFEDIFDVDHFVQTLKPLVPVVRALPPKLGARAHKLPVLDPISWSQAGYYTRHVLPLIRKHGAVRLAKTDARLANNGLPNSIQHVRCRTQFHALRFTPAIEALGRRLVALMRERARGGPFLALHLRYEMDMLAFSGCTHGCSPKEERQLTDLRYSVRHWREKEIDSEAQRRQGLCPLTPEEAGLFLKALGFNESTHVYIAAGEIYGGHERMAKLAAMFPNLVRKDTLLDAAELASISEHSSQQAALDYLVSLESDVFVPTFSGNMAKLIQGHRRYLGFRKTVIPSRRRLVEMLDLYSEGKATWGKAAERIRDFHRSQTGGPAKRAVMPKRPKLEDYFYANPTECLCQEKDAEPGFELGIKPLQLLSAI